MLLSYFPSQLKKSLLTAKTAPNWIGDLEGERKEDHEKEET